MGRLEKEEAQPIVTKYKEEARKLLPPSEKTDKPPEQQKSKRNRQNRSEAKATVSPGGLPAPASLCSLCVQLDPQERPGNHMGHQH